MATHDGTYIVWTRGYAEVCKDRDQAFRTAYYVDESDHNWVNCIEGPDEEDLYESREYRDWERAYRAECAANRKEGPKPTHRIMVSTPEGRWEIVEWAYPPDYKYAGATLEVKRDKWVAALGEQRVKVQEL